MKRNLYRIIGTVLFSGFLTAAVLPSAWASESLTKAPAPLGPGLWVDEPYDSTVERLTETDENGWRVIRKRADLLYLMNHEELWDAGIHFRLGADIDLAGSEDQRPIGDAGRHFSGIFYGDGYTVSGLRMHGSLDGLGLFGYVENAEISGVTVEGTIISTAPAPQGTFVRRTSVGGVVGVGVNNVEVKGCVNRCRITARNASYVGGVIGSVAGNDGEAVIQGCVNEGKVKGYEYSGGLIGYGTGVPVSVISCRNTGNITSQMHVGGIAGCLDGGADRDEQTEIRECMNLGSVLSTSGGGEAYAGGIIGTARFASVYSSINSGSVSSIGKYIGGIIGYGYTENGTAYYLIGCYNGGQVTNAIGIALGAIIGDGIGEGLIAENNYFSAGMENGLLHAVYLKSNNLSDEILQMLSGIGGNWINTSMGPQLRGLHQHESSRMSPVDAETHRRICSTCGEVIDSGEHEWSPSVRYYKYCWICHYSDRMPTDEDGYRIIDDKDALLDLMTDSALWRAGTKYRLTADIDLEGSSAQQPIGSNAKGKHFMGTFDGNGHTISGLDLTGSGGNLGLFGYTEKAVIKNLTIEGTITAGGSVRSVGGLVGANINGITIENCVNRCDVTAEEGTYVGGIVGQIYNVTKTQGKASVISGCVNEGAVNGYRDTGGIVGYTVTANTNDASYPNNLIAVINCRNAGPVTADSYVGGIAGFLRDYRSGSNQTYLSGCLNTGTVTATITGDDANANAGGIAGVAWISNVSGSMNTGAVTSQAFRTGGIVGYGYTAGGAAYAITGNYNNGEVTSTVTSRKGAVIGSAAADGLTTADNYYYKENSGSVGDSYNSSAVTAADVSDETAFSALYAKTGLWLYTVEGPELTRFHVHVPEEERVLRPVKGDPLHHRRLCICLQPETGVGELGTHEWGWADSRKACADCSYKPALLAEWDGKTDTAGRRLIENAADLSKVIENYTLWGEDASYLMTADISLAGQLQRPIGDSGHHFYGSFDGGNHTVSGLDLTGSGGNLGLFGYTEKAVIKNLTIDGTITADGSVRSVGGLVGANINGITIENCVNRCDVTAEEGTYVGGIVGQIYNVTKTQGKASVISGCVNEGAVNGYRDTGGIVGYTVTANTNDASYPNNLIAVINCRNAGPVTADSYVGGIAGFLRDYRSGSNQTYLSGCLNTGTVTATITGDDANANAGGIAGVAWISNVSGSMNTGAVTSQAFRTGGIVGYGYTAGGAAYAITGNYNNGEVTSTVTSRKGAVIGSAAADGLTTADNYYYKENSGSVGDSYNSSAVTAADVSDETAFSALYAKTGLWLYTVEGPELTRFHVHVPEEERVLRPVKGDPLHHRRLCICLQPETGVGELGTHEWGWADSRKACADCSYKPALLAEWDGKTDTAGRRLIENAADLSKVIENYTLWGEDASYLMTADISLAGQLQRPIGDSGHHFCGSFDGGNHTVSGIDLTGDKYIGFFGYVDNAEICNLTIEGRVALAEGTEGGQSIGGLIGACPHAVIVKNCVNRCVVSAGDAKYVGGIAGYLYTRGQSQIEDCRNDAEVSGGSLVGGVIGYIEGNGTVDDYSILVRNCANTAAVAGREYVGGILGQSDTGKNKNNEDIFISLCRNTGNIEAVRYVGGIAGYLRDTGYTISKDQTTLYQCLNEGTVTASASSVESAYAGGITGAVAYSNIAYSMNTGKVSSAGKRVGGITGSGYTASVDAKYWIAWCYNAGEIEGPNGSTCAIAGYAMDEEHGGKEGLQLENNFFSKGEGKHGSSDILHGTQIELTEGEIADRNKFVSLFEGSHPDVWLYTVDGPELRVFHTHQAESERRMLPVADDYENMHQKLCICLMPETAVGERAAHVFKMTDGRMACETCPYKQPSLSEWDGKTDEHGRAVIENAAGLQKLMANEGLWGSETVSVHYVLGDNIDLNELEWQQPIGSHSKPFYGSFDGAGYTISGINLSGESEYMGFFGYVVNTTIENLTIEGSVTSSGAHSIGGLVGATPGTVTLTNCTNRCTVTAENAADVGGLIGRIYAQAEVSIAKCVNEADVTGGSENTGGIAGRLHVGANANVKDCRNTGSIRGGTNVAGVIGYIDANIKPTGQTAVVSGCINEGEIYGSGTQVGGIVGLSETGANSGNVPITIVSCRNLGKVSAVSNTVGGIVGYLKDTGYSFMDGQSELSGCLNEGEVVSIEGTSTGYSDAGGIAGSIAYAVVTDSMNVGTVSGAGKRVGGIVGNGYNSSAGHSYAISYNFNRGEVSGASGSTYAIIGWATAGGLGTESNYYTAGPDDAANKGHGTKVESEKISERESFGGLYERTETWLYTTKGPELETFHEHDKLEWLPFEEDPVKMHQQYCICGKPMGEPEAHHYEGDSTVCTVCGFDSSNPRDNEGRYMISTAEGLLALMERAASGDKTALSDNYILIKDIDLTGRDGQKPIGTNSKSKQFTGSFDGNGHTVEGINISGEQNTAFFGYVNGAAISNLTIEGAISSTGSQSVGGLVGACPTGVTIENCVNKCTVTAPNAKYVGGIAGFLYVQGEVNLKNCTNEGTIIGNEQTGGVVGFIDAIRANVNITIDSCKNTGAVTAGTKTGGIVGYVNAAGSPKTKIAPMTITGCRNEAKVEATGTDGNVGGIIGELDANATLTSTVAEFVITECSNSGLVDGSGCHIGGIAGIVCAGQEVTFKDCTNEGTITGEEQTGGVVGFIDATQANGTITVDSCTNADTGAVTAGTRAGGIVGSVNAAGSSKIASMTITGCSNAAQIKATGTGTADTDGDAGGIVGELDGNAKLTSTNAKLVITECSNSGEISGNYSVGGIIGLAATGQTATDSYCNVPIEIYRCGNSGAVNGSGRHIGGIAGFLNDTGFGKLNQISLSECFNTGGITTSAQRAGGIVGEMDGSEIKDSMNAGKITGNSYAGGIVGRASISSSIISHNYNAESEISGTSNTSAVIGAANSALQKYKEYNYYSAGPADSKATEVTQENLTKEDFFQGFDFESIWMMTDDGPVLRYFNPEAMMLSLATPSNATPSNATPSNAIPLGAVGKVPGRTDSEKDGEPAGGLPDYPVATPSNPEDRRTKEPSEEDGRTSGGEEGDDNQPYPAATPPNASAVRREEEGDEQF